MLGRTEEPDIGMLRPRMRTSGTSCVLLMDGYVEVCIFQINHYKPVLGHDLKHLEPVSSQRSDQLPHIYNGTQPPFFGTMKYQL